MKLPLPSRVPIRCLIITVLVAVAVAHLFFYARKVVDMNQEAPQRNEKLLQNTVTSSLAQEPKAPVFVDGWLMTTLKGDRIVAEFIEILNECVDARYGAGKSAESVTARA